MQSLAAPEDYEFRKLIVNRNKLNTRKLLRQQVERTRIFRIERICAKHGREADINTEAGAGREKAEASINI